MRTRGRKHTFGEKALLKQVARIFTQKKDEFGAVKAAKLLNISLPSFYNYCNGVDLPRVEVLRDAQQLWSIKWDLIDPSNLVRIEEAKSPEQLKFAFLKALREEDVEIARVKPEGADVLSLELKIRF